MYLYTYIDSLHAPPSPHADFTVCCRVLQCAEVCCSVLECVAVCWSVLQCVAECCSVLQCVQTFENGYLLVHFEHAYWTHGVLQCVAVARNES